MKAFFEARDSSLFIGNMIQFPFPLHVHENVELVYILSGSCTLQIDEGTYLLKPGDFAIAFPLVPHSYERIEEGTRGFAAIFPPDTIAEFVQAFRTLLPKHPILPADRLSEDIPSLIDRLLSLADSKDSPLRLAYLHLLLAHILNALDLSPADAYHERDLSSRAIRYLYEHACERISLISAARGLNISKSHLSHLFAQQYHVNFRHFINAIRIDKATALMHHSQMTMTQICYACGYENMRTFRRAFVRETGELPSEYMIRTRKGSRANSAPPDAE